MAAPAERSRKRQTRNPGFQTTGGRIGDRMPEADIATRRRTKTRNRSLRGAATIARTPHGTTTASSIRTPDASAAGPSASVTPRAAEPMSAPRNLAVSTETNHWRSTRSKNHAGEGSRLGWNGHGEREVRTMPPDTSTLLTDPDRNVEEHPKVHDVNQEQQDQLSSVEKLCKKIADTTGAPVALFLAIVIQFAWVAFGSITHWDPYPFAFLLTCSNILQLILIFVIAVAQKQSSQHAELRAEADHEHISRLMHHQEVQEELLMRLAKQTQIDVADVKTAIDELISAA
jgi:uncharacterized membrane protein